MKDHYQIGKEPVHKTSIHGLMEMLARIFHESLAAFRSVPHRKRHLRQADSQFSGLGTAIHEIFGLEVGLIKLQIVLRRNEVLL